MLLSTFGWVNLELGWPPLLWEPFVQVTTRSFSEFPIQPPHPVNHSLRRLNASARLCIEATSVRYRHPEVGLKFKPENLHERSRKNQMRPSKL